ncbi:Mitotic spindle assembly checkpoint protein MAD2A [Trichoplax sp. H2]|uniref:Mitotic spindle assembly checkpoint protein MAD2A n=1 Tax=Trichoplax adhaerens TaxID=10228 RepID=B3RSI0_TRIAD|nr:hypothetical protein TRIADDRAFT_23206 [Trichoplax adhaerens]EDV26514.1 hypothetical protein TRIADDRAFT_23206 [Trichoplax adhaerens]RDD46287.1 Mitotic spindle assembly checkpoint protein MAD2A [Trichoplax sp. H2]|eukprot:XP_002110510.1 hypothetical protein TRIADDRAFT_23206 [Trichoplax adhaerens]
MAGSATAAKSKITLKGSADIVAEFFNFGINSILFQRGIYPPESFKKEQKYGLTLWVTNDEQLDDYLQKINGYLKEWLLAKTIQRLVLVITSVDTNEVIERWQFDVVCDKTAKGDSDYKEKPLSQIQNEIKDVIRQIVATVTFLPLIESTCVFDLLIYTDKDLETPDNWEESGPQFVLNSQEVRLKSFNTLIHKVDAAVSYKLS